MSCDAAVHFWNFFVSLLSTMHSSLLCFLLLFAPTVMMMEVLEYASDPVQNVG